MTPDEVFTAASLAIGPPALKFPPAGWQARERFNAHVSEYNCLLRVWGCNTAQHCYVVWAHWYKTGEVLAVPGDDTIEYDMVIRPKINDAYTEMLPSQVDT